jgi:phosphatidylethanolamine/phosphatidyl-N-methylethanolamine N-methyltransferase
MGERRRRGVPAEEDLAATVLFLRQWLRDPRSIAAIAPSGRELARRMAAAVGRGAKAVVEVGAGTGAVTQALLDGGVPAPGLLVIERNPELAALLARRFPGVEVVEGDAFDLEAVVAGAAAVRPGRVDAVVSGLGLVTLEKGRQRRLLEQAFRVLRPAGRFVQFTYAPILPVGREVLDELGLCSRRAAFSLLNLPPASVYVLTRRRPRRP